MRAFERYEELLDAVDALTIVVPTPAHHAVARKALERGKHVLIEKPIAASLAEADEILAKAKEAGALVATGHARTQAPPPLVSVYAAWLGGDYNAIASAFPTGQSFKDARPDIQRTLRDWSRTWQPSHLAFLLELSVAAHDRHTTGDDAVVDQAEHGVEEHGSLRRLDPG